MQIAKRLENMEASIFSHMNNLKKSIKFSDKDIIDLGIGSPDYAPPLTIRESISKYVLNEELYKYPLTDGIPILRESIAKWYLERFNVIIDPDNEVLVLMGSQDGLSHISQAILNPGDIALIPDPSYPVYSAGVALADAIKFPINLNEKNDFLPQYNEIPPEICDMAKILFLNYPGNPIPAVATKQFLQETVSFAKNNSVLVCYDNAYSELAFDDYSPNSILEISGAKDVCVEFNSFSKSFNMAGCRIGFMVGNSDAIKALKVIKSNIDYGVFLPLQMAAVDALKNYKKTVQINSNIYKKRRDVLIDGLSASGWKISKPKATMFVWAPLPEGFDDSQSFAEQLLKEEAVLLIPGTAFGKNGEGYIRIALVQEENLLIEASKRINNFLLKNKIVL